MVGIAQLAEHLICNQEVISSILIEGSMSLWPSGKAGVCNTPIRSSNLRNNSIIALLVYSRSWRESPTFLIKNRNMRKLFLSLVLIFFSGFLHSQNDRIQLDRYAEENKSLSRKPEVILIGNSITENWVRFHPDFFKNNNFIW